MSKTKNQNTFDSEKVNRESIRINNDQRKLSSLSATKRADGYDNKSKSEFELTHNDFAQQELNEKTTHIPVLYSEVLNILDPKPRETYLDLTAGYGGHASGILERTLQYQSSVLVDRDSAAVRHLKNKFQSTSIEIIHKNFLEACCLLAEEERTFDLILADLGVSSPHLNDASRGFSFMHDAPLDMRMDVRSSLTAEVIVNTFTEEQLGQILRDYGDEPKYRQIARRIVEHRPITRTTELANVVARAWPGHSKSHPATRTFQALRIAVNDELGLLAETLKCLEKVLAPGGRLAIISFHSLEDRMVKQHFQELCDEGYESKFRALTKKPIIGTAKEIVFNPRARSAKLRALVKIKTERGS